jgi:energy-converting hydrogenase Eha subunit C
VTSPTRRQRLRPIELVVMAALVGGFVGVVVLVTTRDVSLASIFAGVAFIAALLLLAMLALIETSDPTDPSDGPVLMRERKRRDRKD